MLIPIRHENMEARRWPVITIALIAINAAVFLATYTTMQDESPQLGEVKAHIILLAAAHPELKTSDEAQQLVESFQKDNPAEWEQVKSPSRHLIDGWDARMRMQEELAALQAEMDSLCSKYAELGTSSIVEQYAFIPARPRLITYLTSTFLHGGWLHLIGNMWFLWLAGFVLEDTWGRPLYLVFYLIGGAAATQFHAWTNPASIVPCVGASGAVAALMGAFLVRFPKMKIEMLWIYFFFRTRRFQAPAYALLPLWLLMEVFYGTLFGRMSGVAHWAHVGGFIFGAVGAVVLKYSGLETTVGKSIEKNLAWETDADLQQASALMEQGQVDQAMSQVQKHLAAKPNSIDAWNLKRQILWKRSEVAAYQEATAKTCDLHLKARNLDAAWQDYEDFLNSGGKVLPAATWFEICRALEECGNFERALCEYQSLADAYAEQRPGLMALMAGARVCLRRLNRPEEALKMFRAAAISPVPHLDLEQTIMAGMREASSAMGSGQASSAGAGH